MATRLEVEDAALEQRQGRDNSPAGQLRNWEIDQLEKGYSAPSPAESESNVEQELLENQEEEEAEREHAFQQQQEQERNEAMQRAEEEQSNSPAAQAQDALKSAGKKILKDAAKEEGAAIAAAAGSAIVSSAPIWAPILGVIVLVLGLAFIVIVTVTAECNQAGLNGFGVQALSTVSGWANKAGFSVPPDVCAALAIDTTAETSAPTVNNTGPVTTGDAPNRALLLSYGITVNKPYPTTSLANVRPATLNEAIVLKTGCDAWSKAQGGGPCTVIVTGGSEDAHAEGVCSHQAGYKLDFGLNSTLDAYIAANFQTVAPRGGTNGGPQWINAQTGADYVKESSPAHWDMVVGCNLNA